MKKIELKNNKAITLIALVVTIIILIILAGIGINELTGSGLIKRAREAAFKTEMQQISEEFEIYKASKKIEELGNDATFEVTNAGSLLKEMIEALESADEGETEETELSKINIESVIELSDILENLKKKQNDYVIIVNDTLYYVCSTSIQEDEKAQWCIDIGIPIWYNSGIVSSTGMNNTKGDYEYVNGIYVCTPQINKLAFSKYNTRYVYADANDKLVPGSWINKKPEQNWYDYANQKWANLYIENDGIDSYWVWIPRYVFKIAENERVDAKFVDINNNYKDPDGNETTWAELQAQGYQLPEAFKFAEIELPGYWVSKYQLSEHTTSDSYKVYYDAVSTMTTIKVQNIATTGAEVAEYQYALNGEVMHKSATGEDYTFTGLASGNKTINVTTLNSSGEIIGSYTYYFAVAEVNPPDTSKFDQDTTFYVYYDEDGTEHNEIPVSQPPPANWYDYTTANWANIVTRNNGVESYWVWIPRYQFQVNATTQRTLVRFIKGTSTETESGYAIPEAFTFAGQELTGYWIAKYQISEHESTPLVTAEMSAGSNSIQILDITGTKIAENQIYEYYINGVKKHEGTDPTENYVFIGLEENKTYTVNIIVRNSTTHESKPNAYIGAVTKKLITIGPNPPDISAFDKTTTYYVTYAEDGTETRTLMSEVEKAPDNWYNYTQKKWANIVTTANGKTAYWVWIPRYQFKVSSTEQRTIVKFINGTGTEVETGYAIPEAFTFAGKELTGYWIAKYQMSN